MATTSRKIPFVGSVDTNPETKPFFEGTAAGKFLIRRCTSCNKAHWYPRGLCPFCFSDCAWEEASGAGTIYSLSVMKRAETPYVMAYVALAEGPVMMTNILDCDFDALSIGTPVKVKLVPTEGGPAMPFFVPA
jgi:uncharacterized OB-fold protein